MPRTDNLYRKRQEARRVQERQREYQENQENARRNNTYSRQERQHRDSMNTNNRRASDYRDRQSAREESNFNRMNQTARRNEEQTRSNAYAREERAFNKGRDADRDRLDTARRHNRYQAEQMQRNARNFVGPTNPTPSRNPNNGSGKEWENHKYIDKVLTKNGKIRYIYEVDTSSGRHGSTKPISNKDLARAKDELNKAKNALTRPTTKQTLEISQRKATTRNEGGSSKYHDPISDAKEAFGKAAYQTKKAIGDTVRNASKAMSDGASFVSKSLSDLVSNTPIKDLFK